MFTRGIQKGKEFYETMTARFNAYLTVLKFVAVLLGLLFSGWTAVIKLTTDEIGNIGNAIKEKTGVSQVVAGMEKGKETIKAIQKHRHNKKAKIVPTATPTPVIVETYKHRALSFKFVFFSILSLILLWFLYKDVSYHYNKWRKK